MCLASSNQLDESGEKRCKSFFRAVSHIITAPIAPAECFFTFLIPIDIAAIKSFPIILVND